MLRAQSVCIFLAALMAGCTFSPNPFQPDQVYVSNSSNATVDVTVVLRSGTTEVFNQTFRVAPQASDSVEISQKSGEYGVHVLLDDGRTAMANVTLAAGSQSITIFVTETDVHVGLLHGD